MGWRRALASIRANCSAGARARCRTASRWPRCFCWLIGSRTAPRSCATTTAACRTVARGPDVSARTRVHRPVVSDLPDDFGERIEEFRVASGLSVRSLARLLGVSPYRVREWRRGVVPDSRHLYLLLLTAGRMGLREVIERPGDDLPDEVERQLAAARGGDGRRTRRSGPPPGGLRATGHSPHSHRAHARERHGAATAGAHPADPCPSNRSGSPQIRSPTLTSRAGIAMSSNTRRNGMSAV